MSTGQKPQFPAGFSAKPGAESTTPTGAGIAAAMRSIAEVLDGTAPVIFRDASDEYVSAMALQAAAHIEAQAAEIERLRAGWLRMIATENMCDGAMTGQCGRAPDKCACLLEMAEWMKEPQP